MLALSKDEVYKGGTGVYLTVVVAVLQMDLMKQ